MAIARLYEAIEQLRGRAVAAPEPTTGSDAPLTTLSAEAPPPVLPKTRRPRRSKPVAIAAPEPAPPPAAAPRLMRRAEVARPVVTAVAADPSQPSRLRGIVRWFDPRTRHGAIRAPGFDDLAIVAQVMEASSIARLYKGQEVEATVIGSGSGARLIALALPAAATAPAKGGGTGSARRHAKPVVVEMKRDAMRRAGARIEAEHVLGNGRVRPA